MVTTRRAAVAARLNVPAAALNDDCIECILVALDQVRDVGKFLQVSSTCARLAAGAPVQAKWGLRIRVLKYAEGSLQPELAAMSISRRPDDDYDLTFGTTGVVTHDKMFTCTAMQSLVVGSRRGS